MCSDQNVNFEHSSTPFSQKQVKAYTLLWFQIHAFLCGYDGPFPLLSSGLGSKPYAQIAVSASFFWVCSPKLETRLLYPIDLGSSGDM